MKAAVVQMTSGKDHRANFLDAEKWIKQAAEKQARLVVLPEMFACMGVDDQAQLANEYFTKVQLELSVGNWAKENSVFIVAGSLPFTSQIDNKVFAASLVFSPEGKIIAQYNKIHLFDVNVGDEKGRYKESDTFEAGIEPVVASIDGLRLGLSVCYDLRFPELYQVYQKQQCNIITVPAAFTYKTGKMHWETLLKARAIETQSFIVAANQCGVHEDGRRTWGHSMIVSPNGEVLAELEKDEPGMALTNLDIDEQALLKKNMPLLNHKRL
jgi:predicted amidohydrolase